MDTKQLSITLAQGRSGYHDTGQLGTFLGTGQLKIAWYGAAQLLSWHHAA